MRRKMLMLAALAALALPAAVVSRPQPAANAVKPDLMCFQCPPGFRSLGLPTCRCVRQ